MKTATKFVCDTNTTPTREFKCPRCGCEVTHRNWDNDYKKMTYQCTGCGHVSALDYKEVYYMRTKKPGAYVKDENGDTIFLGYDSYSETPTIPENPNAAIYEVNPTLADGDADGDQIISNDTNDEGDGGSSATPPSDEADSETV